MRKDPGNRFKDFDEQNGEETFSKTQAYL